MINRWQAAGCSCFSHPERSSIPLLSSHLVQLSAHSTPQLSWWRIYDSRWTMNKNTTSWPIWTTWMKIGPKSECSRCVRYSWNQQHSKSLFSFPLFTFYPSIKRWSSVLLQTILVQCTTKKNFLLVQGIFHSWPICTLVLADSTKKNLLGQRFLHFLKWCRWLSSLRKCYSTVGQVRGLGAPYGIKNNSKHWQSLSDFLMPNKILHSFLKVVFRVG